MKSVLVFRSAALGDFVIANPAFAEVRKSFPNHRVVLLTISSADKAQQAKVEKYAGNTQKLPWVELAMPHLIDEVVTIREIGQFNYMWRLRQQLLGYNFEAVVLMLDPCAPALGRLKKLLLLIYLVGVLPIYGWRGRGALKNSLTNSHLLKAKGFLKHHVHGPLQFLSELPSPQEYRDEELIFDLRPGESACRWASTWLLEHGLSEGTRLLAVAPGSIQPHKRWPLESFRSLLLSLLEHYDDAYFLVIGTPADKELGDVLNAIDPQRIYNLAGITSIAQSAALLQHCHLLVGNDGGAMHLGDAMGCKVVSIVPGIEFPDSIEPWHNKELAVRHPVECSPCYNFVFCPQGHNRCMTELPVERVLVNCMSVLDQQ